MAQNTVEYVLKIKSEQAKNSLKAISNETKKADNDLEKFNSEFKKLGLVAGETGNKITKSVSSVSKIKKITPIINQVSQSLKFFGGAAIDAVKEITNLVRSSVDAVNNLNDLSTASNLTASTIQAVNLAFAASGQSAMSAHTIMKKFPQRMKDIVKDGSTSGQVLDKLNVKWKNLDGTLRSSDHVFRDTIAALQGLENAELRTQAATSIFKRDAGNLLIALGNSGPIERFAEFTKRFGVNAEKSAKEAATFQQRIAALGLVLAMLRDRFVASIGGMNFFNKALTNLVTGIVFVAGLVTNFSEEIVTLGKFIIDLVHAALLPFIRSLMILGAVAPKAASDLGFILKEMEELKAILTGDWSFSKVKPGRMFSDMGGRLNKITKEALAARLMMENFGKELDDTGEKAGHTSKFLKELQKLLQETKEATDKGNKSEKSFADEIAKSQEKASVKLKKLILDFNDSLISIKQAQKGVILLTRTFKELEMPTEELEAFNQRLQNLLLTASQEKIQTFIDSFSELEEKAIQLQIDTDEAVEQAKKDLKGVFAEAAIHLGTSIVEAISGNLGAIQELTTKAFGGVAGAGVGFLGALSGFGGQMDEVGKQAIEEATSEGQVLTAKQQERIIRQAQLDDAKRRVEEFANNIALAIELLPPILINVLPGAIAKGTTGILKALFNLPQSIGSAIWKAIKNLFSTDPTETAKATGDFFLEAISLGFADTDTFNKRSGGRIPSGKSGLKFTGSQPSGLALLHQNEFVVPASGQKPQTVDRVMSSSTKNMNINISGTIIEGNAIDYLVREIERRYQTFGTSKSNLFQG